MFRPSRGRKPWFARVFIIGQGPRTTPCQLVMARKGSFSSWTYSHRGHQLAIVPQEESRPHFGVERRPEGTIGQWRRLKASCCLIIRVALDCANQGNKFQYLPGMKITVFLSKRNIGDFLYSYCEIIHGSSGLCSMSLFFKHPS